ncbi:hypothetical protein EG328_002228 [Venturia inaequalis]|uniref:DUF1765-domain-containing protein n=1 Tax=Venturia inaequalis TaxID=5025 RepID=A0A8H3VCV0_VENIN|nr:hypothetical protein EG328_002228 [Venturia inaequalis]RDI88421.1 hypothetical protein Vi05172_g1335 [Venturia inaequalis]
MATVVERYSMPPEYPPNNDSDYSRSAQAGEDTSSSLSNSTNDVNLPRAASYTYFPQFSTDPIAEDDSVSSLGDFEGFSLDGFPPDLSAATSDTSSAGSGDSTPDTEASLEISEKQPRGDVLRNDLPKLATSNTAIQREVEQTPTPSEPAVSQSLTSRLRRRSWLPGSRSPSPAKQRNSLEVPVEGLSPPRSGAGRRSSPFRRTNAPPPVAEDIDETRSRSSSLSRRLSNKLRKRPLGVIDSVPSPSAKLLYATSTALHLPKSFSTDKLPIPTMTRALPTADRMPQIPRNMSKDKLPSMKTTARKRDELWSVFRNLDGDFQKFQAKPNALKANVVRSSLIPFLRTYHAHASVNKLRPEDLDRRATILSKWWSGLLELLNNKNNQSVSGTDRPAILDGIIGIMERSEWRLAPSPLAPLSERTRKESHNSSASSASITSIESSEFLAESVFHNVRNIFTQNLLGQMGFVVEKMSMRNAPASLVSFCGKTCAHAFFFCPGIADVLVRLWNPSMDLLSRVMAECGHKRSANLGEISQAICSGFPAHLHSIKFTTISTTYRALRKCAPLPLGTHDFPWSSPGWVGRWSGNDSDLFYVFVKHYHLLATEFLPPSTNRTERLCAPGLIFVHAQILTNMDKTIHRNASSKNEDTRQDSNHTFEDILSDPDSAAPTLPPLPSANAARFMAENRLIMLMRDFLSDRSPNPKMTRQIFAQAFADLLKAAARKTSTYDHNACYILCDLLEESILILVRYEQLSPSENSFLDWPFWLDAWKQMVQSQNTTTEIRLYALLYSIWQHIAVEPKRKSHLCSSFLLEPAFFHSRFNHWCPMVRTYFMRLLCWRVARFDGEEQGGEADIFGWLSERLHETYAHYLFIRESAQSSPMLMPSTAPCNPAPGRRLLIVRTDSLHSPPRNNNFLSFDGSLTSQNGVLKRNSTFGDTLTNQDFRPRSNSNNSDSETEADEKVGKKWTLLRTIIGTSKQETSKSKTSSRSTSSASSNGSAPRDSKTPPTTLGPTQTQQQKDEQAKKDEIPTHRAFSFKFSLEWVDRLDRRLQTPGSMRIQPPRLPVAAQQLLQSSRTSVHTSTSPDQAPLTVAGVGGTLGIDPTGGSGNGIEIRGVEPVGEEKIQAKYTGRALAEWALVVGECQSFFERRRAEGVGQAKWIETPGLGVEAFKRPG